MVPKDDEVRRQLRKILVSPQFKTAATQRNLLVLTVDFALRHEPLNELFIGTQLFDHYDLRSHKVRSNATIVRGKLEEYYKGQGNRDSILIRLEPGANYHATWEYRRNPEIETLLNQAQGLRVFEQRNLLHSFILLNKAYRLNHDDCDVLVAIAENRLLLELEHDVFQIFRKSGSRIDWATNNAHSVLKQYPSSTPSHIVLAVSELWRFNWKGAKDAFAQALAIDPNVTSRDLWYAMYLILLGEVDRGVSIVMERVASDPSSQEIRLIAAFYLYVARKYDEACDQLELLQSSQLYSEIFHLLLGLTQLGVGYSELAESCFREASKIGPETWSYLVEDHGFTGTAEDCYPGLIAMALAQAGHTDRVLGLMASLKNRFRMRPIQLALCYTAIGDHRRAVVALKRAVLQQDIIIQWLPYLPLFDQLRGYGPFDELVEFLLEIRNDDGVAFRDNVRLGIASLWRRRSSRK